jgi:predicted Zn-dependent protease
MQARAKVLMDTSEPALRRLQVVAAPGSPAVDATRLGVLYGGALASIQLREFDRADAIGRAGLELASRQFTAEPQARRDFELLLLDNQMARPRPTEALDEALAPLLRDDSRPALLARAQAALSWQRAGDAAAPAAVRRSMEMLQTWVTEHKHDALAWQALAQCAQSQGQRLRALRADAEVAAAIGDVIGATDRFRVAQRIAKEDPASDYVETSIIQSRLREMEVERRKLVAELRGERIPE